MTEKYILVSDDEYVYTLDTEADDYKTLEDFEKQEFENAKKDGVDIKDYEDAILQSASDKYWEWVYDYHLEADTCNEIMNRLHKENQSLHKTIEELDNCQKGQSHRINDLYLENKQLKYLITHLGYTIKYDGYRHISLELRE